MNKLFRRFAILTSCVMGSAWSFSAACILIVAWLLSGPHFHYSDTWQMVINTLTTIITFLMVFLIQNTQNRDIKTIQLKLDELLRAVESARTKMVNLEEQPDEKLEEISKEFKALGEKIDDARDKVEDVHETVAGN